MSWTLDIVEAGSEACKLLTLRTSDPCTTRHPSIFAKKKRQRNINKREIKDVIIQRDTLIKFIKSCRKSKK